MTTPKYLLLTFLALSANTAANEHNTLECYDCSLSQSTAVANAWAMQHLSRTKLGKENSVKLNVIDLKQRRVDTFKVWLELTQLPPPRPPETLPYSELTTTPDDIQQPMNELEQSIRQLKEAAEGFHIPNDVVDDAWRFINCAYCENDINTFLNNTLYSHIRTTETIAISFAEAFGLVKTQVADQFQINLESGGYIIVEFELMAQPIKIVAQVKKIVDKDNNTVPPIPGALNNLQIRVGSIDRANALNNFLVNFNYYIPIRTGVVTIKNCTGANVPACS